VRYGTKAFSRAHLYTTVQSFGTEEMPCITNGSNHDREYCVSLHLGLTDYRTFVGTNLNPLWENFLVPSEDDSLRCQHMSDPLGNGAIVETSDEKIIVLQRSYNVVDFPGYYVFPGGHSEPQEIGIMGHQTDEEDVSWLTERVSQEMFDESSVKWLRKLEFLLAP